MKNKPTVAVHKFTSCDGCQLAFINLGEELLELAQLVEFVHFVEIGFIEPDAKVNIAFIEGSISTPEELKRIKEIRANSQYLITIGACATAGGIQALRNFADKDQWMQDIYAKPEVIETLKTSTAISGHVKVDLELWGCPVNGKQILDVFRVLLKETTPSIRHDSVCMECKAKNYSCVLVTEGKPCLGPVTKIGCGALCPAVSRGCYGCYGPKDNTNTESLMDHLKKLGLDQDEIKRKFLLINSQAKEFKKIKP